MNLTYLGDALDHWKGSVFEYLNGAGVLRDLAIDSMTADSADWTRADFRVFARLLRIRETQLIRHHASLSDRLQYFAEITHQGDLFLDPDTGIATGRVKHEVQYVKPTEVAQLLRRQEDRLIVVYQHVRAQKVSARVDACLGALTREIGQHGWCSYESGMVAMLFLARRAGRTDQVGEALEDLLGRHAACRVRSGSEKSRVIGSEAV